MRVQNIFSCRYPSIPWKTRKQKHRQGIPSHFGCSWVSTKFGILIVLHAQAAKLAGLSAYSGSKPWSPRNSEKQGTGMCALTSSASNHVNSWLNILSDGPSSTNDPMTDYFRSRNAHNVTRHTARHTHLYPRCEKVLHHPIVVFIYAVSQPKLVQHLKRYTKTLCAHEQYKICTTKCFNFGGRLKQKRVFDFCRLPSPETVLCIWWNICCVTK